MCITHIKLKEMISCHHSILMNRSAQAMVYLCAVFSCTGHNDTGKFLSVNFNEINKNAEIRLSSMVGEPEIIALDSRCPEAYTPISFYYISDNYIGIFGRTGVPYKIFDRKSGKYMSDIGKCRRGPGEYFIVSSSVI